MIAVDTNILVYAHREEYEEIHATCVTLLRPFIEGPEQWAIPYPCAYEFISVVTNPKLFDKPTPIEEALNILA